MRFGQLGLPEILILLVVVMLIFGAKRLPELAKSLGSSFRLFKEGITDSQDPNLKGG